jgi:histidyl-tRNA synthetase
LHELGIKNFEIKINDRQILKKISEKCGVTGDERYRDFLIALDKLDKKTTEEIADELKNKGFNERVLEKIKSFCSDMASNNASAVYLDESEALKNIISSAEKLLPEVNIKFEPTLVRGMDYYTGTIYEVKETGGRMSFGGGGRYNNMIGSFSGQDISACGFSLGFERIIDAFFSDPAARKNVNLKKAALLYSSDKDKYCDIVRLSESVRNAYDVVSIFERRKNMSNQLEKLKSIGFTHWGLFKGAETVISEME